MAHLTHLPAWYGMQGSFYIQSLKWLGKIAIMKERQW